MFIAYTFYWLHIRFVPCFNASVLVSIDVLYITVRRVGVSVELERLVLLNNVGGQPRRETVDWLRGVLQRAGECLLHLHTHAHARTHARTA